MKLPLRWISVLVLVSGKPRAVLQCCSVSSLKCPDSCFVGCLVPGLGWAGLGWAGLAGLGWW